MEECIRMSKKEIHHAVVLEKGMDGTFSLKEVAACLQVSYRQAKMLMRMFREEGPAGLVHGNRGRAPANKISKEVHERIVRLSRERYGRFNDTHLCEKLHEEEGIRVSRETVRKVLREGGIAPKRRHRPPKHRIRRPREKSTEKLVQIDGSPHRWFGEEHPPYGLRLWYPGSRLSRSTQFVGAYRFSLVAGGTGPRISVPHPCRSRPRRSRYRVQGCTLPEGKRTHRAPVPIVSRPPRL